MFNMGERFNCRALSPNLGQTEQPGYPTERALELEPGPIIPRGGLDDRRRHLRQLESGPHQVEETRQFVVAILAVAVAAIKETAASRVDGVQISFDLVGTHLVHRSNVDRQIELEALKGIKAIVGQEQPTLNRNLLSTDTIVNAASLANTLKTAEPHHLARNDNCALRSGSSRSDVRGPGDDRFTTSRAMTSNWAQSPRCPTASLSSTKPAPHPSALRARVPPRGPALLEESAAAETGTPLPEWASSAAVERAARRTSPLRHRPPKPAQLRPTRGSRAV